MLIDTHSHLYEPEFDADRELAIARCAEAEVERIMLPAIDSQSYERMFDLSRAFPDFALPMMGLHPTSVNENDHWREDLELVERYLQQPPEGIARFWGVGEIGLDLYWSSDYRNEQIEAFVAQVEMSIKYNLPIVVHTRNAWPEMIETMERFAGRGVRGIFHAFSDGVESYERLKRCGDFLFGIGGVVTFKKNKLAAVVEQMALSEIVLETDCPYLTPAPHRGERNESSYVKYICAKIAEIKNTDYQTVAEQTTANARRIFNL
jgi:TatD DNase family protein